jgi:hypothetical protein
VRFQLHLPCASMGLVCRTSMWLSPRKPNVIVFECMRVVVRNRILPYGVGIRWYRLQSRL